MRGQYLVPPRLPTTLRLGNSQLHVQDGPCVDSKGQLSGLIAIEVPELGTALECAARGPVAPLSAREPRRRFRPMVAEAEALARGGAHAATLTRFRIGAAMQSVDVESRRTGADGGLLLLTLHDLLAVSSPMASVLVARAAVLADAGQPHAALRGLGARAGALASYQPWWVPRAHVLSRLSQVAVPGEARRRAARLTGDPAVRDWLLSR